MSPNYQIYMVNAFTEKAFEGSPTCVVSLREAMSEEKMQKIASEIKQPKTVFVYQADREIFKMRYFTPSMEIDLCGNATIAAFWVLVKMGYLDDGGENKKEITLFTKQEKLQVILEFKNHQLKLIHMTQPKGQLIGQARSMKKILKALNLSGKDMGYIEPVIASTGIPTLMLNLKQEKLVQNSVPDYTALEEIIEAENFDAINLYHLSKRKDAAYQRTFMPNLGVPTEAATATSAAALHYALKTLGVIESYELLVLQGEELQRPSTIYSSIKNINSEMIGIISGQANLVVEGVMNL